MVLCEPIYDQWASGINVGPTANANILIDLSATTYENEDNSDDADDDDSLSFISRRVNLSKRNHVCSINYSNYIL